MADATATPARELTLTRTFNAPRRLVFKAWTDPASLARWWGSACFTNPVCEADARPGGAIRIDMTDPDGTVYPMGGTFHEVVEPERLVFTSTAMADESGNPALEAHNTVIFTEVDGRTTLTIHVRVIKALPQALGALGGMEQGWNQSLDRLAEEVAGTGQGDPVFVLERTLRAPRVLVFKAWTDPERLARWFGPKGFALKVLKLDLRPGGLFHYGMETQGQKLWGRWIIREVDAPESLTFVMSFSDESAGMTRHPFSPGWPMAVLCTVTLKEAGDQTRMTLTGTPINASESEREAFRQGYESMNAGWGGCLEELEKLLAAGA